MSSFAITSTRWRSFVVAVFVFAVVGVAGRTSMRVARADVSLDDFRLSGEQASAEELAIFGLVQVQKYAKAREDAEKYLQTKPNSYVVLLALGNVHHYGEVNVPKALYYQKKALEIFERKFGREPGFDKPWRWHARMLTELSRTYADLDQYENQLAYIHRFNERYSPPQKAERAWPLMKLRRFNEARAAARDGLATEDPFQIERALNALCAIEFEAGDDLKSYDACREAVDHARRRYGTPTSVDLGNYAEAARSVFKLDEAERLLMEATESESSVYGNPWLDLANLYMRGARFAEALSALKRVPLHRASRPAYARDSDRNESRRSLAAFYLLMGRPDDALLITERALVLPDRRAHNSRDPLQDRAITALLDRRARLMQAEAVVERATARPIHQRVWARMKSWVLRVEAWMSARRAAKFLADSERLIGTFALGTAKSAVMPPWLIGELVDVVGHGVVSSAAEVSQARDKRDAAQPYYAAVQAEAALARRDQDGVLSRGREAVANLSPGDALLGARVRGLMAVATRDPAQALVLYERVLQTDPGLFRRKGWSLPMRVEYGSNAMDKKIAKAVARSPRFHPSNGGFVVQVANGRPCLLGPTGAAWGCGSAEPEEDDSARDHIQRIVDAFHATVFAPRVDLSRTDINSLDGANTTTRNPLETLFQ